MQIAVMAPALPDSLVRGFEHALGLGYGGAWVKKPRLAWIAHDASKPQRRPGEHWVGHASAGLKGAGRIENAYLSAAALADSILS